MYRFIIAAILSAVLSFIAYSQLRQPLHGNYLINAFLFILCAYSSVVSLIGFLVSLSIRK